MLIEKAEGQSFLGGPLDVLCILRLPAGTFHVAFFEEKPFPGPVLDVAETNIVRLKSKMHHTQGAPTLEEAQVHMEDMRKKIELPDGNVMSDVAIEVLDPVDVWTINNWTKGNLNLKQAVEQRLRLYMA